MGNCIISRSQSNNILNSFSKGDKWPECLDANNATQTFMHVPSTGTSNMPIQNAGFLITFGDCSYSSSEGYIIQYFMRTALADKHFYVRKHTTSWGAWIDLNPYKWYYTHNDSKGLVAGDNPDILTQTVEPGAYIIKGSVGIEGYDNRCIISLSPGLGECVFDDRSGWFNANYTSIGNFTANTEIKLSVWSSKACTASVGLVAMRVTYL